MVSELGRTYRDLCDKAIDPRMSNARVYVLSALCDALALAEADARLAALEAAVARVRAEVSG